MSKFFRRNLAIFVFVIAAISIFAFSASAASESESNDSYATADTISFGKTYGAVISKYGDKDYFKVVAPSSGKITVKFKHKYQDADVMQHWDIHLYRYMNGDYIELSSTTVYPDSSESVTLPFIGAVKNGVYYICAEGLNLNGVNYKIFTDFTSSDYYEKEINNSYSTANTISLGKTYGAVINKDRDKDYYKVVAPSNGKLAVKFKHKYQDANIMQQWDIHLYRYMNGDYIELSSTTVYPDSSESIALSSIGTVKNGVYYICVEGLNLYGVNYSISTSFSISVSKPSSLSASAKTDSVKLSWNKVSGAKGYAVYKYSSSSGKYTKIGTTTSTSYTVKNLKAGTKYKFAVKAYKTLDGSNYYSGYSSLLTVSTKCSAPTIKLTSTKSKTAKVSITKVTGASKYIVYKSTDNKTWTKAATVTGTTATLSKLTGGKKIYIRVAAVNADGKKSAYSTVKSVTVKR